MAFVKGLLNVKDTEWTHAGKIVNAMESRLILNTSLDRAYRSLLKAFKVYIHFIFQKINKVYIKCV